MHDALLVRRSQCLGERQCELEEHVDPHPLARQDLAQRPPADELHGQEVRAIDLFDRVDGHHPGMAQRRQGLSLTLERQEQGLVVGHRGLEDLQGDPTPEPIVLGDVDLARTALAEALENLVLTEGLPHHGREPAGRTPMNLSPGTRRRSRTSLPALLPLSGFQ